MALITEIGSGSALSESLCSVEVADAYFSGIGNVGWDALSLLQKEQALRKATNYMEQVYKPQWQGLRVNNTQALDWPRVGVTANGYYALSDIVPLPVQRACAELSLKSTLGELLKDTTQQKLSSTVGSIAVTYDKYSPQAKQFKAVEAMLAPYFVSCSSIVHRIER